MSMLQRLLIVNIWPSPGSINKKEDITQHILDIFNPFYTCSEIICETGRMPNQSTLANMALGNEEIIQN